MSDKNLKNCKACNKQIAKGVKKCPHCGKDQRNFFMRHKILTIIIIFLLLGIFSPTEEEQEVKVADDSKVVEEATTEDETDDKEEVKEVADTKEEVKEEKGIVLGKEIDFGDFILTITKYSLGEDYDGNPALIINYNWENISDDTASPFITFGVKAYQDNVETDYTIMVDGVDLAKGQKDIKPGGKIEDAQTSVGIEDIKKPLELEITKIFSFNDKNTYLVVLDLLEIE